jgi:hypothetical protein
MGHTVVRSHCDAARVALTETLPARCPLCADFVAEVLQPKPLMSVSQMSWFAAHGEVLELLEKGLGCTLA